MVVAVSGGIDSVTLLHLLHRLAGEHGLRLHVAHLDHRLRPESAADARFVADLSARLGLPATVAAADVAAAARAAGRSLEHAGRVARGELFDRVCRDTGSRWLALGHHADDQAETFLLRLLRGAGATGLAAMVPVRCDGVLRPLLACRREAILEYARQHGLCWREDRTNHDLAVPRNRVRHELLPHLGRRHNPAITRVLCRTANLLRDEDDYLESAARRAAAGLVTERRPARLSLDARRLGGYHIAVRRRILRQYIQELAQGEPAGFACVEAADGLLRTGGSSLRRIGRDLWAQHTSGVLILRRGWPAHVRTPVQLPGRTEVPERGLALRARYLAGAEFARIRPRLGPWRAAFDGGVALGALTVRSPRAGDRLQPLGMGGRHKKLSDCFIDSKWPRILRPEALLLTRTLEGCGEERDEVLWVAGLGRCEPYRVHGGSERILYLEFSD